MPSIISHPAVPLAVGIALGQRAVPKRLLALGAIGAILPDLDVIAYQFDVPRGTDFGHRGFTHSLFMAVCFAVIGSMAAIRLGATRLTAFLFLFFAMASHGILDSFTNGGSGIAFLWPFESERYFAPVRPIAVSPIGVERFLSERGLNVLLSELKWIWLPCLSFAVLVRALRKHGMSR